MKTIQSMPDIWDARLFYTSRGTVISTLAAAAVRQSPYLCPEDLILGLKEFSENFHSEEFFK